MNLDDLTNIRSLDTQGLINHINLLPEQLEQGWEAAQSLPLPTAKNVGQILVAGMGSSLYGPDLVAASVRTGCSVPISIERQYDLPVWARGPGMLVIISSYSGNTEETLSVLQQAHTQDCSVAVLTTGGALSDLARKSGDVLWLFEPTGHPITATGLCFGLLMGVFYRMGLIPDPSHELQETLHAMRNQQTNLIPEVPVAFNPAKRMAGQMLERLIVVFAADYLEPVARQWKDQINKTAKAWAQFETLPEGNHNTIVGLYHPENSLSQMIALFLTAPSNHPRNKLRIELTRKMFMVQGINTDVLTGTGEHPMAHLWTLAQLGEYISYYLAVAYGEDPTYADEVKMFKQEMGTIYKTE